MSAPLDPIAAEVIAAALVYASEEMGIAVRDAAYSPNIKERLDHSCAIFDARARLVAQAEHIPVHLGSLPWGLVQTLAWMSARGRTLGPGDAVVVNDPYLSGTHVNDVTLVRAVFADGRLVGYVANKAHHTDVGGSAPGSMPPDARDLFSEGIAVPPMLLVRGGTLVEETVELFRANSRTPDFRAGDLRAQIAGLVTGERRLLEVVARYGAATVDAALAKALDDAELRTRAALREFPDGSVEHEDVLEDASGAASLLLRVRLEKRGDELALDYTGTSPQVAAPLNAVFGVTLSGAYYAIRALTGASIATNEGSFRPVRVHAPEGTLLNPQRPAPVGGGNVETSMRNADLVLGAFAKLAAGRVPAQSGGSMNNVMLGGVDAHGRAWSFYETIGCGMGARPSRDGLHGIHAHMTNTLNTPIEAIEREFPLLVTRYEFAGGSGGDGRFRGGDGLVRAMQLTGGTATVSLLAERHTVAPQGTAGGGPGACGSHALIRTDGTREALPAKTSRALAPGETIVVTSAGGGGYGRSPE